MLLETTSRCDVTVRPRSHESRIETTRTETHAQEEGTPPPPHKNRWKLNSAGRRPVRSRFQGNRILWCTLRKGLVLELSNSPKPVHQTTLRMDASQTVWRPLSADLHFGCVASPVCRSCEPVTRVKGKMKKIQFHRFLSHLFGEERPTLEIVTRHCSVCETFP